MCNDREIVKHVLIEITQFVRKRLQNFEVPRNITLVSDVIAWTPDTGLATAAMKLKRKPVEAR